jgi:hypothetical protein
VPAPFFVQRGRGEKKLSSNHSSAVFSANILVAGASYQVVGVCVRAGKRSREPPWHKIVECSDCIEQVRLKLKNYLQKGHAFLAG